MHTPLIPPLLCARHPRAHDARFPAAVVAAASHERVSLFLRVLVSLLLAAAAATRAHVYLILRVHVSLFLVAAAATRARAYLILRAHVSLFLVAAAALHVYLFPLVVVQRRVVELLRAPDGLIHRAVFVRTNIQSEH